MIGFLGLFFISFLFLFFFIIDFRIFVFMFYFIFVNFILIKNHTIKIFYYMHKIRKYFYFRLQFTYTKIFTLFFLFTFLIC